MKFPFSYKILFRFIGFFCLIGIFIKFDYVFIIHVFCNLNLSLIFLLCLFNIFIALIKLYRWHYLLQINDVKVPLKEDYFVYMEGLFWGFVSPARAGEFVKCYAMKRKWGCPYSDSATFIVIDRLYDLSLIFIGIVTGGFIIFKIFNISYSIIFIFLSIVFILYLIYHSLSLIVFLIKRLFPILDTKRVAQILNKNCSLKGLFVFLLSLFVAFMIILQGYILSKYGYKLPLYWYHVLFFMGILSLSSLLPVSLFGIGSNEVILLFAASLVLPGLEDREPLIAFSMTLTFLSYGPLLVYSGLSVSIHKLFAGRHVSGSA